MEIVCRLARWCLVSFRANKSAPRTAHASAFTQLGRSLVTEGPSQAHSARKRFGVSIPLGFSDGSAPQGGLSRKMIFMQGRDLDGIMASCDHNGRDQVRSARRLKPNPVRYDPQALQRSPLTPWAHRPGVRGLRTALPYVFVDSDGPEET